jgi:hypothetical protein
VEKSVTYNILGGARAEVDEDMLDKAFVKTHDYEVLTNTRDFNFVVGRRGTGKSALFLKLTQYIKNQKIGYVFSYTPKDYEQISLKHHLTELGSNYSLTRSIMRVAWRVTLLLELIANIKSHYKYKQLQNNKHVEQLSEKFKHIIKLSTFNKVLAVVKEASVHGASPYEIPGLVATKFEVENLTTEIESTINEMGQPYFLLFDGLDDGWSPDSTSTAILGGLALCVSDFRERNSEVCVLLFFRDNIFRSLQYFDDDFSRHIEGSTLRLAWDEASLFQLVADRLRVHFSGSEIESDGKIWNKIAASELKNINGFRSCLNYTLFRPRDIIVLLNETYALASKSGRNQIIPADIESTSKQISKNRLTDLLKEYQNVFPGLGLLINSFSNGNSHSSYGEVINHLDSVIMSNDYAESESSDFAILGTGEACFFALYSVGFIGFEISENGLLHFCHDGSPANIDAKNRNQNTCVHPCYWKALNIQSEILAEDVKIEIYDDIKPRISENIADQRTKRIGQIIAELPNMSEGNDDASKFEDWVLNAVKILFSGNIRDPEIHTDYGVRDIVFEVKNFSEMKIDNYRQALSYSGKNYGKFIVLVNRSPLEHLSTTEQGWLKEFWFQHEVMIFSLPAPFLSRCISKLRTRERFDYVEDKLEKRLNQYKRSYLSLKHDNGSSKAKKKK